MRAARMHARGKPFQIDEVEVPTLNSTDVLVKVKACGIVPNLGNVLNHLGEWYPHLFLPPLPAVFGLDAVGVVVERGKQVRGIEIGQRVYVNPARYCGGCEHCRVGETNYCASYTFNGYFGFGPGSLDLFDDYPVGGLAEYMTAPQYSLVTLPDSVSDETAARWGYLGTGYRALKRGQVGPRSTVVINGISGTLGLSTALFALALGAKKIFGVARDRELLARVEAIAPGRIEVHSVADGESVTDWVRRRTDGRGADVVIDALGPGALKEPLLDAFGALGKGGYYVYIGAVLGEVPLNLNNMMCEDQRLAASNWFTTADGQEMAALAQSGMVDLSVFEHEVFSLDEINDALAVLQNRHGGFSNYVVKP
ncbi:alcohol dehydrogenase catalytic domain-containing protein [Streptomyces acidicola]|uniref:alcohol dehydrogenase catalytic domain-containing protein n=1 Tax=Streptomyces acidicola TaxID=2596892 RepID=UPI0038284D87